MRGQMKNSQILMQKNHSKIAVLSFNRPEKRNALNIQLMRELVEAIEDLENDFSQRILIVKGEGSVFCSGMDLSEATDPKVSQELSEWITKSLSALYSTRLVTIAVVQGAAIGGGAGLMSCCDFVVAEKEARFGYPEVRRGLVAAQVLTFLRRQVKERDVRELLFLGELIDSEKALSIGLINRIVSSSELASEAQKLASVILKGAPKATSLTKKLIDDMNPIAFTEDLKKGIDAHKIVQDSTEVKEGIKSFLEHRAPNWVNFTG
jgi:methylglutaconyl-CoA hydratase